ncbi:MAG: hypothetical protein ACK4L4_11570 [Gemmobacter sp.]
MGISAVGVAIERVIRFVEPVNTVRILGIWLILAGIAAVKFALDPASHSINHRRPSFDHLYRQPVACCDGSLRRIGGRQVLTHEIIVNGTFSQGNLGWSGTALETNFTQNAYLGNGSTNRVAEMDGNARQITVGASVTTAFTFRTALRTASLGNAGRRGFRQEILDTQGNHLLDETVNPPRPPGRPIPFR